MPAEGPLSPGVPGDSPGDLLIFWAKLPRERSAPPSYHPLLCHMIDVAMVARAMWQQVLSPAARSGIAASLGLDEDAAGRWLAFLGGLHDLGKCSPAFALQDTPQAAQIRARLERAGLWCPTPVPRAPHGSVTTVALRELLQTEFGLPRECACRISTVVGGHHGMFPSASDLQALPADGVGEGRWEKARTALARVLSNVVGVEASRKPLGIDNATAMVVAGLVSVADWIGSNDAYFPFAVTDASAMPQITATEYSKRAEASVQNALERLCWTSPLTLQRRSFESIFPGCRPRPVQEEVISLADEIGAPALVVIEAPMGEGKTEAGIYLADHWATSSGQTGCYFALPTQATSNQMFGRVRTYVANRYADRVVNLQLLHGQAALSAEFTTLRQNAFRLFEPSNVYGEDSERSAPAHVVAAEWFTFRKRGLLAPFGVGTVDQILLAALKTWHVFVRLFGLAHKTVIVDEVHAYDAYMSTLLERLLEWLGALGTSVVLLSATLPDQRRRRLVAAYRRGLRCEQPAEALPTAPYPRLSWATATATGARSVATSPESTRTIGLDWIDGGVPEKATDAFALGARLKDALSKGGCAAVICNTVGRAQQVYDALKPFFTGPADDGLPKLDLLHARYLFKERDGREKRALVRFGKENDEVEMGDDVKQPVRRPDCAVLVSTQLIEQSLDLDFDLIVTDLAPADLVLQRIGRLHRHRRQRPPGLDSPMFWLCHPEQMNGDVPSFGRGTERVYDRHVLLRSWLTLKDRTAIQIPGEVEEIVEAVYDARPCSEHLPGPLRDHWEETRQQQQHALQGDVDEAKRRWLARPDMKGALWWFTTDPREEDAPDFHQAHQALTRLAEPTASAVCLHGSLERPTFDRGGLDVVELEAKPEPQLAKRLLQRSVSVADRRVVFSLLAEKVPSGWQQSPLLRQHRLVVLDDAGRAAVGRFCLHLNDDLGLIISAPEQEGT